MKKILQYISKNIFGLMIEIGLMGMFGVGIFMAISDINRDYNTVSNLSLVWLFLFGVSGVIALIGLALSSYTDGNGESALRVLRPTFGALGVVMIFAFVRILLYESNGPLSQTIPVLVFSGMMGIIGSLLSVAMYTGAAKAVWKCARCPS